VVVEGSAVGWLGCLSWARGIAVHCRPLMFVRNAPSGRPDMAKLEQCRSYECLLSLNSNDKE
jgi:hypothetical protein